MADKPASSSSEWSAENVRRMLKSKAVGGKVAAQVFFQDGVSGDRLPDAARQAISEAAARVGNAGQVEVGKVHRIAKSVSVKGDPDVIAELANAPGVKTVLPSEIDDIYPKPVTSKRVP